MLGRGQVEILQHQIAKDARLAGRQEFCPLMPTRGVTTITTVITSHARNDNSSSKNYNNIINAMNVHDERKIGSSGLGFLTIWNFHKKGESPLGFGSSKPKETSVRGSLVCYTPNRQVGLILTVYSFALCLTITESYTQLPSTNPDT